MSTAGGNSSSILTPINLDGLLPTSPTAAARQPRALQPLATPFTILIDSAEKQPFTFQSFHADAAHAYRPLTVRWRFEYLGAGQGDYTLEGFRGIRGIAIERKSLADCQSTILGWGDHRRRFEAELENLNQMQFAAVVVEASFENVLAECEQWGKKTAAENRKALFRSVQAYQQRWPKVQWQWCEGRRFAEQYTFRHLQRFFEHKQRELKRKRRATKNVIRD